MWILSRIYIHTMNKCIVRTTTNHVTYPSPKRLLLWFWKAPRCQKTYPLKTSSFILWVTCLGVDLLQRQIIMTKNLYFSWDRKSFYRFTTTFNLTLKINARSVTYSVERTRRSPGELTLVESSEPSQGHFWQEYTCLRCRGSEYRRWDPEGQLRLPVLRVLGYLRVGTRWSSHPSTVTTLYP